MSLRIAAAIALASVMTMNALSPALAAETPRTATEQEIANLAQTARKLDEQVKSAEAELARNNLEIIDAYQRLDTAKAQLDQLQETVDGRFAQVYKNRGNEALELLLNFDSLAGFWTRVSLLARLSDFDNRALTDRTHQLQVVRKLKNTIAAKKLDSVRLRRSKIREMKELQATLIQKEQLMQVLNQRLAADASGDAKYLSEFALSSANTP